MRDWGLARAFWALAVLALVPLSFFLWMVGGYGMCGMETYDTPPGSFGDSACNALVGPVTPWALMAATPLAIGFYGGLIAIRLRSGRLFIYTLVVPFLLVAGGVFFVPAVN
jgi:hypothetical protein